MSICVHPETCRTCAWARLILKRAPEARETDWKVSLHAENTHAELNRATRRRDEQFINRPFRRFGAAGKHQRREKGRELRFLPPSPRLLVLRLRQLWSTMQTFSDSPTLGAQRDNLRRYLQHLFHTLHADGCAAFAEIENVVTERDSKGAKVVHQERLTVVISMLERHPFRPKIRRVDHDDTSLVAAKGASLLSSSRRPGTFSSANCRSGARPRGSACLNSKLSHLIDQRSSRQSKPIGRSVLPSDQPVGLFQCFQDMFPIGIGKRA